MEEGSGEQTEPRPQEGEPRHNLFEFEKETTKSKNIIKPGQSHFHLRIRFCIERRVAKL